MLISRKSILEKHPWLNNVVIALKILFWLALLVGFMVVYIGSRPYYEGSISVLEERGWELENSYRLNRDGSKNTHNESSLSYLGVGESKEGVVVKFALQSHGASKIIEFPNEKVTFRKALEAPTANLRLVSYAVRPDRKTTDIIEGTIAHIELKLPENELPENAINERLARGHK